MRFPLVAARLALAALLLAALIAAVAILSVRLGGAGFATGLEADDGVGGNGRDRACAGAGLAGFGPEA